MAIVSDIILAVIKSVVGEKVGNKLANEIIDITINEVSESWMDKINNFINEEKAKIGQILSKKNLTLMNMTEDDMNYVAEEIKDLFRNIEITNGVLRQCKYDAMSLSAFLWNEYCEYKGGSYIECESHIKKGMMIVAEVLIELIYESKSVEKKLLTQISNSVDDIIANRQREMESLTERFNELEENLLKTCNRTGENFSENVHTIEQKRDNKTIIDELIDELMCDYIDKFDSLEVNRDSEYAEENSVQKMLYKIAGTNLVTFWSEMSQKYFETAWNHEGGLKENKAGNARLDKRLHFGEWLDPINKFSGSEMMYFTIADNADTVTLIYMVNKKINPQSNEYWFELEFLEYSEKVQADGTTVRRYFIDNPSSEGNPLIFLSFIDDKECVCMNVGFLDYEEIKVFTNPTFMEFYHSWIQTDGEKLIHRYKINRQGTITIIDPEYHIPLETKEVYNEKTGRYESYIELQVGKKYFACLISNNGSMKVTPHMLGYNYYIGQYGLKQNWLKAAEWLIQSYEPKDAYYLGIIFMKDKLLRNKFLAKKYLAKAAELGIEMAYELLKML